MNSEKDKYIKRELDIIKKKISISISKLTRPTTCNLIVIDHFYKNPVEIRNFALTLEYPLAGNGDINVMYPNNLENGLFPGKRSVSYATEELKDRFQKYIQPFGGKITKFYIPGTNDDDSKHNGCFQLTNSKDQSYVTYNEDNSWGGVIFLSPLAPLESGIHFYQFNDGATSIDDSKINETVEQVDTYKYDMTKWKTVDSIGNMFNRLVLFKLSNYHMYVNKFGNDNSDCGLFQLFFFSTER